MSSSNYSALSSYHETFDIMLIEGLTFRKLLLTSHCGGPDSFMQSGSDDLLAEKGNVESLSVGLLHLSGQASRYDAGATRFACLDRFGYSAVVEQVYELYVNAATKWKWDHG